MDEPTRLLTPDEAAERLGICTKTLRHLRAWGHIRYVAITERKIRYRPEDCEEFIASRVRQETPHPGTSRQTRRYSVPSSRKRVIGFMERLEEEKRAKASGVRKPTTR